MNEAKRLIQSQEKKSPSRTLDEITEAKKLVSRFCLCQAEQDSEKCDAGEGKVSIRY